MPVSVDYARDMAIVNISSCFLVPLWIFLSFTKCILYFEFSLKIIWIRDKREEQMTEYYSSTPVAPVAQW